MDLSACFQSALFQGMREEDLRAVLPCLAPECRTYEKGEWIWNAGEWVSRMGVVLRGTVFIAKTDVWGNQILLDSLGPGQIFGEVYACSNTQALLVDVFAGSDVKILFLRMEELLQLCPQLCPGHSRLIQNLLVLVSQKNLTLSRKIFYTSPKTIRERLRAYLSDCAQNAQSKTFLIPLSRQQLAEYLNVDRSALSHEISKMQQEGLLQRKRNQFTLCFPELEAVALPLSPSRRLATVEPNAGAERAGRGTADYRR